MNGIPMTRELAWLQTCRDLFSNLSQEQKEGLLRNLPLDCEALRQAGIEEVEAVVLKMVEIKAFEIEVNSKGLELAEGEKVNLYSRPAMWCSLLQQLAFIREK